MTRCANLSIRNHEDPPVSPMCLYLVHPAEYATVGNGFAFFRELRRAYLGKLSVRACKEREGHAAFYAVRLLK